jgi:hypothetical protein
MTDCGSWWTWPTARFPVSPRWRAIDPQLYDDLAGQYEQANDDINSVYDSEHHHVTLKYIKDKIATLLTNREIHTMLIANTG